MTATSEKTPDFESATAILRALQAQGSASPAALTKATGLSRATVHRRLTELQESGFVEGLGAAPRSKYRVFTPVDLLLKQAAGIADLRVAMLTRSQAQTMSAALELLARLSIGQWNVFCEDLRVRVAMQHLNRVEQAETVIARAKEQAWHLPSNASLGIYNEAVPNAGKLAWQAHRTIRHRLAWDRQPEGSMGVHHDEPMSTEDGVGSLACWSGRNDQVLVLFSTQFKPVFLQALTVYREMTRGNALVLMDFLSPQHDMSNSEREACVEQLGYAKQALESADLPPLREEPDWAAMRHEVCIFDQAAPALTGADAETASRSYAQSVANSMELQLPAGFLLGSKGAQTRVLQLGVNDASVIRGASYSPQTAVLMALNMARAVAAGKPAGSGRQF